MKLIWRGHACFSLECEDGTIVFDPFEDGSVPGIRNLDLCADLVLCSHEHYDHNARSKVAINNNNKTLGDFPGADPVVIRLFLPVQGVWV